MALAYQKYFFICIFAFWFIPYIKINIYIRKSYLSSKELFPLPCARNPVNRVTGQLCMKSFLSKVIVYSPSVLGNDSNILAIFSQINYC